MTQYEWDARCADLELSRLERGFTGIDHAHFARVILTAFARVVQDVHIESGSLLSSIKVEPLTNSDREWSGQISAGGSSAGVKNPVRYAASEYFGTSPKHGGPPSHNYFRNIEDVGAHLHDAAGEFVSRGRTTPHPEGPLR